MERSKMPPLVIVAIVLVVGVAAMFVAGIFSATAVPSLQNARVSGNEASAIGSLRAIASAQQVYATMCSGGGYAVRLEDLGRPAKGTDVGFISPDLAVDGVIKSGYRFTLSRSAAAGTVDVGSVAATCNGSTGTPVSAYFASAEPVTPGDTGRRYFATDSGGVVYESASPIANPLVVSDRVTPVR